jgi:diguanylate cyclase (GGDEF)-like protein
VRAGPGEPSAELLLEAVLESIDEPTALCDADGVLTFFNRAASELLGAPPERMASELRPAHYRVSRPDGTPMAADELPLVRALREGVVRGVEVVVEGPHGGQHRLVARGRAVRGAEHGVLGAVVVLREVTEALHDTLTGLPNRALLEDHVRRALERSERKGWVTAMLAIDIDQFRHVNDRLGLEAGDRVLVEVARRLETALRPYDTVARHNTVARLGGDKFFVLCEDVGGVGAAAGIAARLAGSISMPTVLDGVELQVSACVGIALQQGAMRPDALILDAEAAVRRAKQQGPARQEFFAESMRVAVHERIEGELALRRALEEGQLRLAYQPKVDLGTGLTAGVEALLRWEHPERGTVAPLEFIGLAEDTGLFVPIGAWVLEEACRQAADWAVAFAQRPPLHVSVNVSARQFDADVVEVVDRALTSTGADPRLVCLEVTESTVMTDVTAAVETLGDLKALGVTVSVDDFGTGYSSLAYLRRLPLDELKVDQSFVNGLGRDPEDTAIVAAVMGMSHALDLVVVAEGVETQEQLAVLQTLGCEYAQGYYFARPQHPDELRDLLIAEAEGTWVGHQAQLHTGAAHAPGAHRSEQVLVVDDTADVRQLAHISLTAAGFEVHEAADGRGGLALAAQLRPDCVVLDVRMPDLDGYEVCRMLRAEPATSACTIVMLTGEASPDNKIQAFTAGADDYIIKPFAPRELVTRVRAAMRRRQATAL